MADEQYEIRVAKRDQIRDLGFDPYGGVYPNTIPIQQALDEYNAEMPSKEHVTIAGRIMAIRGLGKVSFCNIKDQSGSIQFYVKKNILGDEGFTLFDQLDIGDIVGLTGPVFTTKTGETTIEVHTLTILSKSLHPLPEKFHGLKDPELRFRHRYIDMIANEDVLTHFTKRAKMMSLMRRYLDDLGYMEVETPMMHPIPGGAAARPFITHHNTLDMKLYMRIATEIYLKKLMVGGIEKIYEIGKNFRNEGVDTSHNPEFTAMELYHAYGDLRTVMELTENLVAHLAQELTGSTKVMYGEREIDLTPPWPRLDYIELLKQHAELDELDDKLMIEKLHAKKISTDGLSHIDLIDKVFSEYAEPHLQSASFVCGQPIVMSPLCREIPGREGYADRFEAFVCGMELANAYTELNDPAEQRQRLSHQSDGSGDEMVKEGKIDEDFLLALEYGMPPAGGLGIGIDRLAMILTNNQSIREVIFFPLLRDSGK